MTPLARGSLRKTLLGLGAGAGIILFSLGLPAIANAYVQSRTSDGWATVWRKRAINIQVYTAEPPRLLNRASLMRMVTASAAAWSYPANSCTDLALTVAEVNEAAGPATYDDVNRITFRRDDWRKEPCDATKEICDPYPGNAIAITTVTSNKRTGEILDADIELNAVSQVFADIVVDGARPQGSLMTVQDLQNTLTHEMGHFIGLDHNCFDPLASAVAPKDQFQRDAPLCSTASAAIAEATMFNSALPGETKKRDLADDDLTAICEVYPPIDDSGGGCTIAPQRPAKTGGAGTWLLGLGLLTARFTARRRRC